MRPKKQNFSQSQRLVNECAHELGKIYPHWSWVVQTSDDGSVVMIYAEELVGVEKKGFIVFTREIQQQTDRKRQLTNAGGEYLESYGVSRSQSDVFSGLLDARGQPLPVSGVEL